MGQRQCTCTGNAGAIVGLDDDDPRESQMAYPASLRGRHAVQQDTVSEQKQNRAPTTDHVHRMFKYQDYFRSKEACDANVW